MPRAVWKYVNANHESGFAYFSALRGELGPATASRVVVGDEFYSLTFKGEFALDQGVVQSGTITGFDLYENGVKIVKAKGYSFSYDDLVAAMDAIVTNAGPADALIAGKTTYRGSNDDNAISSNDHGGRLFGKGGDDLMVGGLGDDLLKGGRGNDTIRLGKGNDTAIGGKGSDTFLFIEEMSGVTVDKVKDFQPGKDILQIAFTFGDAITPGELLASEFRIGKRAKDEDDHIVFWKAKGAIYYDPDGRGGDPQVLFAKVQKGLGLTHNDFLIEGLV